LSSFLNEYQKTVFVRAYNGGRRSKKKFKIARHHLWITPN
jgi:hypothetical protein